jgi:DNA helicase IV
VTLPAVPTDLEDELKAERAHLAESREALQRMRERAEALFATGADVSGDPFGAESLGRALARRIAELSDDPSAPLFFGRLDMQSREQFHIGRRHVVDNRGEPLVLDWRAPLSRAFYRASVRDPQEVAIRRRFGWQFASTGVSTLTSFEDEHLDRGEELGTKSKILTSEIERPRVGPMRDIVATIQPEQDELVRADLDVTICVQGAPGTGKTAVGLHRAAYLLYLHRERMRRAGVLIVGPNRAFLHYIAAVLPALGEIDVEQATVEDLVATAASGSESIEVASIKHDARMAQVLRRALFANIGKPQEALTISDGSFRWRVSIDALRRVVDDVRREDPPYALGRERVRARVVSLLLRQAEAKSGDSPSEVWQRRMGKSKPVVAFLDAVWPALTPQALVFSLLSDPDMRKRAADGILTEDEQAAIQWVRIPRSLKAVKWTAADAVLIDEAAGLIERPNGFGHVVLDEAQDLSPMQCRAIARRTEHGSITLLGDLAQGTAPWAARDWADTLTHLGKPGSSVVPLTVGFRVPEVVLTMANRLLPALDVNVPGATSLRNDGELTLSQVDDLTAGTVEAVRHALKFEGSVGVIAAESRVPSIETALAAADVATGDAEHDVRVSVLPATVAKGLEYDHVIVVEPAEIVEAEPRGMNRLYVVLTRAVSRLAIVHDRPMPDEIS